MNALLERLYQPKAGYHVLRLSVSAMMLFHGIAKLRAGTEDIEGLLATWGLPKLLVAGVYVGEVVAPLLALSGVLVGISALIMAINMLFAIALAHSVDVFSIAASGGWGIELQALYLFGSLALALLTPSPAKTRSVKLPSGHSAKRTG